MRKFGHRSIPKPARVPRSLQPHDGKSIRANPEEFDKHTSAIRERLTRDVKDMPPEERIKQGR